MHRQCPRTCAGKDNSAPAEDLLNKNPSLVALGKKNGEALLSPFLPRARDQEDGSYQKLPQHMMTPA